MSDEATESTTSTSLLIRLRQAPADQAAWAEFVRRYGSRIPDWGRRWGLQEADAHDVTVRWSILASPKSGKNMLVKYHSSRITLHHNLMMDSDSRFPQIDNDDEWTLATDTTVDLRNNLMWDWGTIATRVSKGVRVNAVNNYYSKASFALLVNSLAPAYTK